ASGRGCAARKVPAITVRRELATRRRTHIDSRYSVGISDQANTPWPLRRRAEEIAMEVQQVLITGASGNLGSKLRRHLEGRYALRLLDIDPRGDGTIFQADLSCWDRSWVDKFAGADVVVHLAADPAAHQIWPKIIGPNLDGMI